MASSSLESECDFFSLVRSELSLTDAEANEKVAKPVSSKSNEASGESERESRGDTGATWRVESALRICEVRDPSLVHVHDLRLVQF